MVKEGTINLFGMYNPTWGMIAPTPVSKIGLNVCLTCNPILPGQVTNVCPGW